MTNEKVSIIIPLYNGRSYIFKTVENLSRLQWNKEIIVVDDGSKDDSETYCRELCEKFSDVKVFRKENGGICTARNHGLSVCSGKYVMFVDQDDSLDTDTLKKAIGKMVETQADVLFWSCYYDVDGDKSFCDEVKKESVIGQKEVCDKLLPPLVLREPSEYTSFLGHVWAGIYSMDLLAKNDIRFRFFIDYEDDQLFVFDVLRSAEKVAFFKPAVYFWNYNPRSYSNTKRKQENLVGKYEEYLKYLYTGCEKKCPEFPKEKLSELDIWGKQFTFCEAVRNAGIREKEWKSDIKDLKKLEKSEPYRSALKEKPVHIREKKYRLFLTLSKMHMTGVSVRLSRLYFKRKLRKAAGAKK